MNIKAMNWNQINWNSIRSKVRKLQMRIAKAVKENRWNKVRTLQHLLTHSFHAKLLAVKRVTSNKGKKTPGIDSVLWLGTRAKWRAVFSLRRRGYKAQPLRRIYIPKKNGKKRPLSIPCMIDRAQQAVHKLALSPVAETNADRNSYGFREGRSCADAIAAGFNALSKPNSATWILEGDIKGCFDNISQAWMLANIPMDKQVLRKWLRTGYVEDGRTYPMTKGTPQGGIISPTLSNMTLDGLERAVHDAVPSRRRVNFVRYADDFIITGKSKRLLEKNVKPAIERFLAERGLALSQEKTLITHIKHGFSFLGQRRRHGLQLAAAMKCQTFRKRGNILHITPAKEGVLTLMGKVRDIIRKHVSAPIVLLIKKLNQTLRGWANYHRWVVSSAAFYKVDTYVHDQLWRMLRKRHPSKPKKWLIPRYWQASGREHVLAVCHKTAKRVRIYSVQRLLDLNKARYIKIKADANPYLPDYAGYYYNRRHNSAAKEFNYSTAREYRAQIA